MLGEIIMRLGGRYIVCRDELGLVHRCKGYVMGKHKRLYWTLCNRDAPAEAVHAQTQGEAVTCPECRTLASEPARRILQAHALRPRAAVGGPPYRSDPD